MHSYRNSICRLLIDQFQVVAFVNSLLDYAKSTLLHLDLDFETLDLESTRTRLKSLPEAGVVTDVEFDTKRQSIQGSLRSAMLELASREAKVDPASLRQLLYLVSSDREKALNLLLRFYRTIARISAWNDDLTDKVDLTLTLLSQELNLVEFGAALAEFDDSQTSGQVYRDDEQVDRAIAKLRAFRDQAPGIRHLDDICRKKPIREYRKLKHELGPLLLEPRLSMVVVGTNQVFREIIDPLLRSAERELREDYEAVNLSSAETLVLPAADAEELQSLHTEIENLDALRQTQGLAATHLATVRDKVRSFAERTPAKETPADQDDKRRQLETENRALRAVLAELTMERQELREALREIQHANEGPEDLGQYAS